MNKIEWSGDRGKFEQYTFLIACEKTENCWSSTVETSPCRGMFFIGQNFQTRQEAIDSCEDWLENQLEFENLPQSPVRKKLESMGVKVSGNMPSGAALAEYFQECRKPRNKRK